jgi:hypothetical protein
MRRGLAHNFDRLYDREHELIIGFQIRSFTTGNESLHAIRALNDMP